jgi:hypothetical protein
MGGGLKAKAMPSGSAMKPMPLTCRPAASRSAARCSQGFMGMKMVAALLLLPPPMRSKPLTMKMLLDGLVVLEHQPQARSVVASVRSSVAPSGSCAAAMM